MGNRTQVNRAMLRLRAFPRNLRRRPLVESFVATFVGFQSFRQRFRQRFHFGRLLGQAPLICWGVLALAGALPLPCLAQADRTAEITRCLEQLQSADPHERSLAKLLLVRPPNLVQLEPFKDRLLTILGTNLDSEESAVILGRLTLPKEKGPPSLSRSALSRSFRRSSSIAAPAHSPFCRPKTRLICATSIFANSMQRYAENRGSGFSIGQANEPASEFEGYFLKL